MTYLHEITFPVLVIADDGWVGRFNKAAELSMWTYSAIMKYKRRHVVLYDAGDHAWKILDIIPEQPIRMLTKLLAQTFYNPKVPVRIEVGPITETPLLTIQSMLYQALDADDDILTQEAGVNELKNVVQHATSFETLVTALEKKGAI